MIHNIFSSLPTAVCSLFLSIILTGELLPHPPHPPHPPHNKGNEWSSCLDHTCSELQSIWSSKFHGDMPPCPGHDAMYDDDDDSSFGKDCAKKKSPPHHHHSSHGGGSSSGGSSSGGSSSGGSSSGGSSSGGSSSGGSSSGGSSSGGSGGGDDDASGDSSFGNGNGNNFWGDSGSGGSGGSVWWNPTTWCISDCENRNTNDNDDGEDSYGDDVVNPYDSFDISRCSTYENYWKWDLSLSCNENEENCECTGAQTLIDNGLLSCPKDDSEDPITCPAGCSVCDFCLKLLGCEHEVQNSTLSSTISGATTYAIVAAAVGAIIAALAIVAHRQHRKHANPSLQDNLVELPVTDLNDRQDPVWLAPMT